MTQREEAMRIREQLQQLADAWEKGEKDRAEAVLKPNLFTGFSIFEPIYSAPVLAERLAARGDGERYGGFAISNFVCHVSGEKAQQSCALTGRVGEYGFAASLVVSWEKIGGSWKAETIVFDLTDDNTVELKLDGKGGISRVEVSGITRPKGWRPLQETNDVYDNCRLPCISGELQAPWAVIADTESGTEEEQVEELFYRLAFAFDRDTFSLVPAILDEGAKFALGPFGEFAGPEAVRAMKSLRRVIGTRGQHVASLKEMKVNGCEARAEFRCVSPGVIRGTYRLCAVRRDDGWKIRELTIE